MKRLHHDLVVLKIVANDQVRPLVAPFQHANLLLRPLGKFAVIVSDTEGQSVQFLGDIANELETNDGLREAFGVKKFLKRAETDVIVMMDDGWRFRIIAKGSEQKVRGLKWRNKRPDLIICDDLENDEIVMNPDRRRHA